MRGREVGDEGTGGGRLGGGTVSGARPAAGHLAPNSTAADNTHSRGRQLQPADEGLPMYAQMGVCVRTANPLCTIHVRIAAIHTSHKCINIVFVPSF